VGRYQKGKTNLDFTGARDSGWQWHQLGHMQVCTSLQTDNHASTSPLSFLQAGCPSCRPTNGVKALKADRLHLTVTAFDMLEVKEKYGTIFGTACSAYYAEQGVCSRQAPIVCLSVCPSICRHMPLLRVCC